MAPSHVRVVARLHVMQLTGESVGQPLSSAPIRDADLVVRGGRQHWRRTLGSEPSTDPAESKTLCMRGHSMLENREISIVSGYFFPERSGKACGHKPDVYAVEKSDIGAVCAGQRSSQEG